jgi:pimeloyl-ACP methyl ester carboxylesterase
MSPDIFRPRSQYLKVDRLRLHYLDWGGHAGQTLLLLHGFMGHARVWDELAAALRDDYHVIALDQRGHGESQWSATGAYGLEDHFADITQVMEQLNLKHFVLIGHSMGGRNALFSAACLPEKVHGLIVIDSRPGNSPQAADALRRLLRALPLQAASLDQIASSIRKQYPGLSPEIAYRLAAYGYRKTGKGQYIPKCDLQMSLSCANRGCRVEEIWSFLKNVTCPTLVVRGENSPFLSREDAETMCKLMPQAAWTEISRASHLPPLENPEGCKHALASFLNRLA